MKAVPFALEDQLASPVEDLHFALGEAAGGKVPVAVVARAALRRWLEALAAHGIRADAMLPDVLALAPPAQGANVFIEGERSLLRNADGCACACDSAALDQWLGVLAPTAIEVRDCRAAPRAAFAVPVTAYQERCADPLAELAAQLREPAAIDLLQGEFAPIHRHAPAARLWRRAALFAAAAIVLGLAYAGGDYLRLKHQAERLDVEQREALRSSLPDLAQVPGDPRSLMESALRRLRGDRSGTGLLPLLSRVAPVLAGTTRVQLRGLEYRNATLELALRAPDVPALDLVREQLAGVGLDVEVTAANSGDHGVEGRLRVSGGHP